MLEILIRGACFIAIIALGYVLRRVNFFHEGDFQVISKIVLKITLPAAIISSFAGKEIDPAMLTIGILGFGGGVLYMGIMYLLNRRSGKNRQAFEILNSSGYNIGNFAMPFVQSFLGPTGVIATSLFDTGNAFICLGGAYSVASAVKGGAGSFSLKRIITPLLKSVPFDCYVIMTVLCLLHIPVPFPVTTCAEIIGNANAFLAMLMVGVGFRLTGDRQQIGAIVRIIGVRYGLALILALGCFFLFPMGLEIRQVLAVLMFSPIASAAPAFTAELGEDVGLSSAVNSISIVCSIVCMVITLSVVL